MKCFYKVIGVCIVFAFFIMTNAKTSIVHNRQLKVNKLHHYFNNLKTEDSSKVNLVEYRKFVKDSLSDIKNNSSNIRFVEVSEFTDSLLVRFITSDKVLHNYSAKFNSKKSKHIGTTYVSTQPADNFINNDLKKIISILEFNLDNKSFSRPKEVIGDYAVSDVRKCNTYYFSGGNHLNNEISNSDKPKYDFQFNQGVDDSIYLVEHLLNNYSFEKFDDLWKKGFLDIEKIYGKPLVEIKKEYEI